MVEHAVDEKPKSLFQVRVCRMTDGERFPLVVGPDGVPVPTLA
jgi:hypothetical protein